MGHKMHKRRKMIRAHARRSQTPVVRPAFEANTFLRHGTIRRKYTKTPGENRLRKKGPSREQQMPLAVHDENGSPLGEFGPTLSSTMIHRELKRSSSADETYRQVLGYLRVPASSKLA